MLDHVFTDAISALRDAFEAAFLERQAFEEHFQVDVLLGNLEDAIALLAHLGDLGVNTVELLPMSEF